MSRSGTGLARRSRRKWQIFSDGRPQPQLWTGVSGACSYYDAPPSIGMVSRSRRQMPASWSLWIVRFQCDQSSRSSGRIRARRSRRSVRTVARLLRAETRSKRTERDRTRSRRRVLVAPRRRRKVLLPPILRSEADRCVPTSAERPERDLNPRITDLQSVPLGHLGIRPMARPCGRARLTILAEVSTSVNRIAAIRERSPESPTESS